MTNVAGGPQGAQTHIIFGHIERLHALIHELFPVKPAACLADITGLSMSAWHKSLRDRRDFSSAALLGLFRSAYGPRFLRAFIGEDYRGDWFVEFQILIRRAEIEQWERDLRGIDEGLAQANSARRHQADGTPRQVGAPPGKRRAF
jgi:hypothetical protein